VSDEREGVLRLTERVTELEGASHVGRAPLAGPKPLTLRARGSFAFEAAAWYPAALSSEAHRLPSVPPARTMDARDRAFPSVACTAPPRLPGGRP
jgi:hypothetical protein